jgi:hypothetical protein
LADDELSRLSPEQPGPEPAATQAERWREERWGAVVLLAGLTDDNADRIRRAANEVAGEWADREAAELLLDAATPTEIGA